MKRIDALTRALLCAMVLLSFGLLDAKAAACATLYVPDDYVTIQEGIKAARDGDTVIVRDGTYVMTSPVTFRGKAITVRSENGPHSCIIDANGRSHVIDFNCWETKDSVLSGFTITNGSPDWGVIYCFYSSPTISNCIITGNTGKYVGGIFIESDSSPTITDCTISENTAEYVGGIYIGSESSPTITNCTISENTSPKFGGITVGDASPIISNCNISGNTGGYAGAIVNYPNASPTLINCVISGNTSGNTGAILCDSNASPTLINCTIAGNTGESGGGAISSLPSSSPFLTNCILWDNSPNEITGDGAPVVSFSDVEGGWPGTMNIDSDPSFMNPAGGDYHLKIDSPCIDAGDNAAEALPETDMEGNPRIISGTVDMGAYEYEEHALPLVRIDAVDAVASEPGLDRGRFRVTRSRDTSWDLTVRYSVSGTARNGEDYRMLTGVLTIPAGSSMGVVRVRPLDDFDPEPEESVVLTLVESGPYEVAKKRTARVVILDND